MCGFPDVFLLHSPGAKERVTPVTRWRVGGYTLIEILVVVAILAMLATIGVQQLLRARITVFEQIALSSLRSIAKGSHFFFVVNGRYPDDLFELAAVNPPYIDSQLQGDGTTVIKQGYVYTYQFISAGEGFDVVANPEAPGMTGVRYFYMDENLEIHFSTTGIADENDPILP